MKELIKKIIDSKARKILRGLDNKKIYELTGYPDLKTLLHTPGFVFENTQGSIFLYCGRSKWGTYKFLRLEKVLKQDKLPKAETIKDGWHELYQADSYESRFTMGWGGRPVYKYVGVFEELAHLYINMSNKDGIKSNIDIINNKGNSSYKNIVGKLTVNKNSQLKIEGHKTETFSFNTFLQARENGDFKFAGEEIKEGDIPIFAW